MKLVSYGCAYAESLLLGRPTIRHRNCDRVIEWGVKCLPCKGHRNIACNCSSDQQKQDKLYEC